MSESIKIQGNKIKIFETAFDNDGVVLIIILLIIKNSVDLRSTSVKLHKIAYILDMLKKNRENSKFSTLLGYPWDYSGEIRKKLILAHQKGYININETQSVINFSLTQLGEKLVEKIEGLDLIRELRLEIAIFSRSVKLSELSNQNFIW